ncbi:hypothetical protein EH196_19225 [Bacillus sp. C1-1]|nr:hypothetical protein EH196_19225 [Bacillus sp. C1-1]
MDKLSYTLGAKKAIELNEGDVSLWKQQNILPLSQDWLRKVGCLSDILVGGYNINDSFTNRVIGGGCIHKSGGEYKKLPLSFLWEALVVFMFCKKLNVPGIFLIPIAEEAHNYPDNRRRYFLLSKKIKKLICRLSEKFEVQVIARHSNRLYSGEIEVNYLYGLFQPYTSNRALKYYPLGDKYEKEILQGYESYCLRYRYPHGEINYNDIVVDGIHLSKSVILGLGSRAKYIPTLPIKSLYENCLLVDSSYNPSIFEDIDYRKVKFYNEIIESVLGFNLEYITDYIKKIDGI